MRDTHIAAAKGGRTSAPVGDNAPKATAAAAAAVACELGKECRPDVHTNGAASPGRGLRTTSLIPMLTACAPNVTAVPRNHAVFRSSSTAAPTNPAASHIAPCSPLHESNRAVANTLGNCPQSRSAVSKR